MALTFDQYVKNKDQEEKNSGKLTFDQYVKQAPARSPVNVVDLLPEPEKTRNDNHDVLHSIAPATTASEIKEASVNRAKSDANTIGMINDVIWGDVRNIPSRIGAWSDARKALKSGEIPMDYSGANFNPATDLYVQRQNEQAEKERTEKQNAIKAQLDDIDKQIRQSKATAAQYRARTGGLANSAERAEAHRMVDDANRKTEELQQQRQKLMNELHSVGGKYGVGDIIGDTGEMVFSNAGLQAPDLVDYYLSRGLGLIDENDKEAYDRAHALQYDRAQQIAEAQSGRGKFGQDYMQAAAAFGDMLSNTAVAYASGIPQALQTYGSAPATALQNSGIHDLDPSIAGRVISGADKLTGNILADAISSPTNVAISLSSGVHTFDEAKTKGASTGQAFAAAMGSAAAEYFSNKMFSGTPLENNPAEKGYAVETIEKFAKWLGKEEQVQKFFSNKLASFIFDKTGEGWEEVITAVLEPWIAHYTYDESADLATLKELWNEWYIGTFMSVIADATEPVTQFRAQKAAAREKENEQRRQNAMAQYLAYAAGNANADFHETVSNNYDLLKNVNPADIAKAYNVGRNYNRETLQKQSDLETLAAGTMGAEGLKLAAEKRGTMADTDPVAYYNEARQAYDMGRSGGENTFKGEILSTKEANAWYNAGINDAKEDTNEQRQSGNESQGRFDGLDSQRQGGRLAESAGGQLAGEAAEGQRDGGSPVQANDGGRVSRKEAAVKLSQGQALTSAAENGISNGTEAKTMHVISEDTMDQWHPEMVEVYNKGKQNGITVKYYTGRMALDDGHGVFFVRGLNVGDGSVVWIRADADEDIRKIADHEFFHTAEKRDPGLKQRILDKITENKQSKTLQALTQKYADKYDGSGLSDDEILSEICADSYGGIDIFAGITDAKDATEEQKARATDLSETVRGSVKESKPKASSHESANDANVEKTKWIDRTSREIGLPEAERKTLEKNNATVADGVVIADTLAPAMESPEFHKPVSVSDLADLASHDTLPAWAEKYINGGGSKEALKSIQRFDDMIWKSISGDFTDEQKALQALVPSGHIITDKFGPLRTNEEYRRSFDMDTSCPRTFQFVAYRNAIMKRLNRTLTFDESINLINLMSAYHQMIPCTYCYVENKRILKAAAYNNWYRKHYDVMSGLADGLAIEDLRPKMYGWDETKGRLTNAAETTLNTWIKDKSGYNPTAEENYHAVNVIRNAAMHLLDGMRNERKINANTTVKSLANIIAQEYGLKSKGALTEAEKMAEDWRYDVSRDAEHVYLIQDLGEEVDKKNADRALEMDNEAVFYSGAAAKAKLVENYAPYGGELEKISKEDRDYILGMGGIRKHSSNDFRVDYVLDYFQFFADLAKGKWTGHTYTKSADYVRIFGRTGDMINMSIAFNDTADGVVENVNEGMEHKLAKELREAYDNAGVMAMVTSAKQLSYALNADWVDMIIPFHNSNLPRSIWYNMKAWTDYTSVQSEALYSGDEMKEALSSRGIDAKGMKADQVRDLFYQTFGIKQAVKQGDAPKKDIGKQFAPHFYPYETVQYGVTIPGHDNSYSKYMELCKEYGVHPRFDGVIVQDSDGNDINVVDHPGYMKLVKEASRATENFKQPTIEFSFNKADPYLTEKYGKEYGKKSVTPMDYAMARLNEEAGNGGYKNAAEDQFGIVDEFVRDYAGKGRSIGWLSERAGMVKDELDSVQDKIVDANRKATLEEFKETAGEKAKPKVRSNFYAEKNMASREGGYDYYSREVDDDATLKRLNMAEQEGVRNFKDIKPGDQKGVVKVYRAMQAQPVDESGNVIPNASVRRIVSYDPLVVEAKVFTGSGRNKTSEVITAPAKLFSPMAGQNNGVWRNPIALGKWEMSEGHPERATTQIDKKTGQPKIDTDKKNASYGEVAYFYGLEKGGVDDNGKPLTDVPARYNPYSHTSLSALNDQFSSAEKRPELVTVEALVPVWHINNGAENERLPRAKDRVGAMSWHSGPTSSRLAKIGKPRTVILTRYDKPVRVVPDPEVARSIADTIGDSKNVAIKGSTVTPSLANELRALGIDVLNEEEWTEYDKQFPTKTFGKNMASRETDIGDSTVYNRTVILKEDTVDKYLKDYAAESSPKYAQAYIAYMTPDKFLDLTTSAAGRARIANETGPLDLDKLKSSNVDQPIQLIIDHETGEVTGHEGRHRMKALMRAGVENIPVLLFDSSNKYSKTAIDKLVLKGQFDDRAFATVRDMQPLSYENRDAVMQKVATQPTTERLQEKYNGRETVRYSREDDTNRLMQENIDLRQRLDIALADTKRTTAWRANAKDVARVADYIIEATSSNESKAIVAQKIRSLVEAASNGGIDSAEMKDLALDIARGLLKRSSVLTTKDSTTYGGVRDYLKSVYINVPSEMRKEITDWKAFAAAHKAMRMKTTGVAISAVYKEMQKRMGKDYFPDMDSDIDKLRQIAEILDTLTPVYDNPYSVNMAEATEETANSILESILNIGQAEPTYADRAKARENEVRELYQQKLADQKAYLQQRIQDEADKRKQQTEAVKQHYTEMQENRRLRKQDSEARQKLLRVAKRLQNRKLDAVNRAMVDQLIGDLDTVSVNLTNRSLTNLKELAEWYDSYKDDPNFLTDSQVEKKLSRLEKRHIGEMTLDEVRDLTDVLRSIENALATYGKMVRIEDHRLISEMSEQSQENIRNTKGSKKNIADWLVTNTLAPERLLRRLTGYNDSDPLYMRVKELSEGQRKMMDYQMRAEALFSKWANDKKLIERLRDKDTIKVRAFVDGKETSVEITPDMRMALYLHSLNDQNLKHIMNGGVRIPDIELYRNGDTKEAYSRGVTAKMSPDMVRGIANGMSAEERAFANAAKAYFNGMSRDEINAVSEALLGYSLANVENYFPIQTDDAFTMKEIDAIQNDGSIQGMGFTKERQNASNAIYLVPMTDVLKRSIQNHAKYVGMAIPVANMNRLWMANTKDGETDTTSGLKDTMRSKWGDRANEAVEKILTDVQNPVRKTDDVSKALAKVRSNYAGAVLTLNASVAMKQAASYPTAAAVLGWEPLLKAMKNYGKVDLDLIAKYTPLQWYRSQGFSTQELGDIKSQSGLMDKVLSAHITTKDGREVPLLNWIQGIDLLTTRKLWKASEYYVQQNQKNMRVGSDEYYKAVADIYNRVIEETQPNYTTMQRPQLLRSDNQLLQSLVMFKTQPFQNFNILYDAIGELRAAETMAKNGDPSKLKQARQNAVNAVTSNLVSAVVFAAMTMAWALARRKREKYEDKDGNFSPWGQLGKDILSSELGMIPFGSDAYNLLASMFLGEKYYGMTNITSDSLSGMTESTLNAFNTLKETVTALLDGDDKTAANPEKIARKLFATAKDASKLLGIPMENVLNLMTAVYSNVASAVNGEYTTAYEVLRLEKGFTSSSSKSTAYDILYKAYQNDRSQYNELRRMMVDDGFKESSIDSAMKKRAA